MAASLTKEQLKNELISHGISPPVQSARKEEFVKLYEQHVAPIVSQKGDFSSDDDEEPETKANGNQVNGGENGLVCNGVDISKLSDEDLYAQLQSFGVAVGPILESTRALYQRKLATVILNGAAVQPEHTNGNGNGSVHEDKYSDSEGEQEEPLQLEPDVEEERPVTPPAPVAPAAPVADPIFIATPEPLSAVRKRITTDRPPSSLSALPLVDRQGTPTPRPSIHSMTSSEPYKYESRRLLDTIDGSAGIQSVPGSGSGPTPVLRKIVRYALIVAIILAAAYIVFTCVKSEQFKQLVEGIQQKASQYLQKAEEVTEKVVVDPVPETEKPDPVLADV